MLRFQKKFKNFKKFLSGHVIAGMIYTDHDDTIFQNNQVYNTLNPNIKLISTVTPSSSLITNSEYIFF